MSYHEKNKKRMKIIAVVMTAILLLLFTACAAADSIRNPLAIDMVLVIENSDRMNTRNNQRVLDANGLRFDAASALISMCDAQYSRATFFMFNEDLYLFSETETGNVQKVTPSDISLFNISIPVHKPQRQNLINILNGDKIRTGYGTFRGTDIGKAIAAAVDVEMRDAGNGNRKVILMLTAGNNKLSEESLKQARAAKKTADENGIEIYTVALKDNSATTLLQELATKPANYQFASTPEDLVDVYRTFFADMIGSNPMESKPTVLDDGSSEIALNIPNNSVAEVNIIIPKKQVEDLTLTDQRGKVINKTEDNVLMSVSRNFVSYKLISPRAESYTLRYKSADEQNIVVQYVFSYSVQVSAKVNASRINKNDPVTITAQYTENGIPTSDDKLYSIPATLTLWKGSQMIEKKDMEPDGNQYKLVFDDLESYGAGEYHATIHFEGDGLVRDSETVEFELINNPPELISNGKNGASFSRTINMPKIADSYDVSKNGVTWDLNDFVKDINNDKLTPGPITNTSKTDASCSGMILTVTPRKDTATSGEIRLTISDPDGGVSPELVFNVSIENYEDRYDHYTARFDAVKGLEKNSTCEVTLRLFDENNNEVRGDNQLPETVEATVTPSVSKAFDIVLQAQGGAWVCEFPTDEQSQDYQVTAAVKIGQKTVQAEPANISSANKPPVLKTGAKDVNAWEITINDPADAESYKKKDKTWTLTDLVEDPNGDKVTFKVDKQQSISDVEITLNDADQTLTITSKNNQEADGDVLVHSADNEGLAGPDLTFHVVIKSLEEKYKQYTVILDKDTDKKSSDTVISLAVYDENQLLVTGDNNLPDSLDASVTQDNVVTPLRMTRGEDGKWTGTLRTDNEETSYTIAASVRVSDNVSIVAPEITLKTVNAAPEVKKQISSAGIIPETINVEPFLIWNQETGDIVIEDLNEFFNDEDGDKLKFTIAESTLGENAETVIEGDKLTIRGLSENANPVGFKVTATDNEGLTATSDEITFSVKSLQKQGLIIIAMAVAALIVLFILYRMMKPAFHNQYFDVSTNDRETSIPQGKSISMKGKKAVKLNQFTTASAKQACGNDIPTTMLNSIILKPAYSDRVKIRVKGSIPAQVMVGTTKLTEKKGGTLSPNGQLSVKNGNTTLLFKLNKAGMSKDVSSPVKPVTPSSGTGTTIQPKRSGRT